MISEMFNVIASVKCENCKHWKPTKDPAYGRCKSSGFIYSEIPYYLQDIDHKYDGSVLNNEERDYEQLINRCSKDMDKEVALYYIDNDGSKGVDIVTTSKFGCNLFREK
jgi:hypothetical protein